MCSYNDYESLSAATTSKAAMIDTERDVVEIEDDREVTQKIITSPPPKKVPRKRPEKFTGEISKEKDGGIRPPPRRLVAPPPKKRNRFPSNTTPTTHRHISFKIIGFHYYLITGVFYRCRASLSRIRT